MRYTVALLFAVFGPGAAGAQTAPVLPPLLSEEEEIALARSAAPPEISATAEIWVLRRGGHVKVRDGTNGCSCIVTRDNPESLYPICYDAEGTRSILPVMLHRQRLREEGRTEDEIDTAIGQALASGELRVPDRPAMSWMMSPHQVLFAGATGRRVGPWSPHVMIYMPYLTRAQLGYGDSPPAGLGIGDEGRPTAHLVVVVPDWAKSGS